MSSSDGVWGWIVALALASYVLPEAAFAWAMIGAVVVENKMMNRRLEQC
jgi:hypothetical protein